MASPAVWAIVANNFAFHYAFYVVMNWLPTYFNRWVRVRACVCGGWGGGGVAWAVAAKGSCPISLLAPS